MAFSSTGLTQNAKEESTPIQSAYAKRKGKRALPSKGFTQSAKEREHSHPKSAYCEERSKARFRRTSHAKSLFLPLLGLSWGVLGSLGDSWASLQNPFSKDVPREIPVFASLGALLGSLGVSWLLGLSWASWASLGLSWGSLGLILEPIFDQRMSRCSR